MSEAEALVEEKPRRFQVVWLLPVAVIVIGAFAVGEAYLEQGPVVTVTFDTAEGLQAGKTKVKALSVEVGIVEEVRLADDLGHVVVTAQLDPGTGELLREDSQLWVVRPRVGTAGVSGLSTLLSGAYIELFPGKGDTGRRDFDGLENIPTTEPGVPGIQVRLYSDRTSSVGAGDPVLYRGFEVGKVESVTLDLESSQIRYGAFIDAPYDGLVKEGTRFWNASGLTLQADASGIRVSADSLVSLVTGGISFDVPSVAEAGEPVADGALFRLYPDQQSADTDPYEFGKLYVVRFAQSLRGLEPGAPVEYRGIRVGTVMEIMSDQLADFSGRGAPVPVLIRAEPGRFGLGDSKEAVDVLAQGLAGSVANGLRATAQTGNLITGRLYVSLDHYADAAPAKMDVYRGYPTLPTRSGRLDRIERQVTTLLAKLNALPLEQTADELNQTLDRAQALLASLHEIAASEGMQALPDRITRAVGELENAADAFGEGSEFYQRANVALVELQRTLQRVRGVARTIEDKPNSLIFSQGAQPDPVPRAGTRQ